MTACYGRFSDSIAFLGIFHLTSTNCVLRQKFRAEKYTFVIISSLVFLQTHNIWLYVFNITKHTPSFVFESLYLHKTFLDSVSNQYIYSDIFQHVACDCKLWNVFWFHCIFWEYSRIIDYYSCLKCCIYNKLLQVACLDD